MFVQSLDAAIEVFQPYQLAIYSYTFICISKTFTNFLSRRTLTVQLCAKQYKQGKPLGSFGCIPHVCTVSGR